jgi:hypothetical protein
MAPKTNKIFLQSHQCDNARKYNMIMEQYQNMDGSIKWYHVKDSFYDAFQVSHCPYCRKRLPIHSHKEEELQEIEQVALGIVEKIIRKLKEIKSEAAARQF